MNFPGSEPMIVFGYMSELLLHFLVGERTFRVQCMSMPPIELPCGWSPSAGNLYTSVGLINQLTVAWADENHYLKNVRVIFNVIMWPSEK